MPISRGRLYRDQQNAGRRLIEGMKWGSDVAARAIKLKQQADQIDVYRTQVENVNRMKEAESMRKIIMKGAEVHPGKLPGYAHDNKEMMELYFGKLGFDSLQQKDMADALEDSDLTAAIKMDMVAANALQAVANGRLNPTDKQSVDQFWKTIKDEMAQIDDNQQQRQERQTPSGKGYFDLSSTYQGEGKGEFTGQAGTYAGAQEGTTVQLQTQWVKGKEPRDIKTTGDSLVLDKEALKKYYDEAGQLHGKFPKGGNIEKIADAIMVDRIPADENPGFYGEHPEGKYDRWITGDSPSYDYEQKLMNQLRSWAKANGVYDEKTDSITGIEDAVGADTGADARPEDVAPIDKGMLDGPRQAVEEISKKHQTGVVPKKTPTEIVEDAYGPVGDYKHRTQMAGIGRTIKDTIGAINRYQKSPTVQTREKIDKNVKKAVDDKWKHEWTRQPEAMKGAIMAAQGMIPEGDPTSKEYKKAWEENWPKAFNNFMVAQNPDELQRKVLETKLSNARAEQYREQKARELLSWKIENKEELTQIEVDRAKAALKTAQAELLQIEMKTRILEEQLKNGAGGEEAAVAALADDPAAMRDYRLDGLRMMEMKRGLIAKQNPFSPENAMFRHYFDPSTGLLVKVTEQMREILGEGKLKRVLTGEATIPNRFAEYVGSVDAAWEYFVNQNVPGWKRENYKKLYGMEGERTKLTTGEKLSYLIGQMPQMRRYWELNVLPVLLGAKSSKSSEESSSEQSTTPQEGMSPSAQNYWNEEIAPGDFGTGAGASNWFEE